MTDIEKTTKPKQPSTLNQEQAAELLGISVAELVRSRQRGLPPGKLAFKGPDGQLKWRRTDLNKELEA